MSRFTPVLLTAFLYCCSGANQSEGERLDATSDEPVIELVGEWEASTGETAFITDKMWGVDTIWAFDNDKNYVVTQTASNAPTGAGTFNKIIWTNVVNDSFYACYALFGYENTKDLLAAETDVDATDPASGCNGFPWFFFVRTDEPRNPGSDASEFNDAT